MRRTLAVAAQAVAEHDPLHEVVGQQRPAARRGQLLGHPEAEGGPHGLVAGHPQLGLHHVVALRVPRQRQAGKLHRRLGDDGGMRGRAGPDELHRRRPGCGGHGAGPPRHGCGATLQALVADAGLSVTDTRVASADGYEMTFAVNYLAHAPAHR